MSNKNKTKILLVDSKKIGKLLLLICISLFPQTGFTQTIEEAFDLQFQTIGNYRGPWVVDWGATAIKLDSTQMKGNGFYPVKIGFGHSPSLEGKDIHCYFILARTIVLPTDIKEKKCTISLNCKSEIDSLHFIVIAMDKKGSELYKDTVLIHSDDQWRDYPLYFNKEGTQAVKTIICYHGNTNSNLEKNIYLNQINLQIDDRTVNSYPVSSIVENKDTQLKAEAIVPLSFEDATCLSNIKEWQDKKIIALGESMHGNQATQDACVQFIKHLITNQNCKLVLLENREDIFSRYNLYLQGKIPDSFEDEIIEELKGSLSNYQTTFNLLKWIKHYNTTNNDTIRVLGIDNIMGENSFIVDYLLKLSTSRQDSIYYLHAIDRHQYQEIKEYIVKSGIPAFLGEHDLKYLLFLLDETEYAHSMKDSDYRAKRDFNMAKRVEQIVESYLSPTEKAVILAHSFHINKNIPTAYFSNTYSAGYYLHQKYDKQYYSISFQVGKGSHSQDSTVIGSYLVVAPLKPTLPFAFEQAGLNTDKSYFYYPSDQLPSGVLGLNMIPRQSRNKEPFVYCNIPSHFDALVFIQQGGASQIIEKSPVGYLMATISLLNRRLMLLKRELKE